MVDDEDYGWLTALGSWYAAPTEYTTYAKRGISIVDYGNPRNVTKMHVAIMLPRIELGVKVDHLDGDGLNNQRSNLRLATQAQNLLNRGPQRNNCSGFKGVSWHKGAGKWTANISVNGSRRYLGVFDGVLDAAAAYNKAAVELHGEFAWLNDLTVVSSPGILTPNERSTND
jgi:hypothetical protein